VEAGRPEEAAGLDPHVSGAGRATAAGTGASGSLIVAAGGVLWRPAPAGPDVLVIHRAIRNDWSWPKGKAEKSDADAQATALREVEEETGLRCELGAALGTVEYTVDGRPKIVHYWMMRPVEGAFRPNREVDRVEWMVPERARELLDYDVDRVVLDRFLARFAEPVDPRSV
jgi:8-oxo-dGTP diphosphatase